MSVRKYLHWGVGTATVGGVCTADIVASTGNVVGWLIFISFSFLAGVGYRYCKECER